ncbi:MAG TPA: ABC transporter permease subunit [Streptosporangiaceae bacterium]|jgi:hypothetical protein|nr:ABC transporter permease subunit [Streptosporangiaceae bacterium]
MIWLTWRQFRAQAIVAAVALAALAVALAVTGPHITHLYDTNQVASCQANGDCQSAVATFLQELSTSYIKAVYFIVLAVVLLAPALIGIFCGAPLIAREVEAGTFRLAWNQSVTRTRWTAIKLAAVGLASVAVAELASLMLSWWSSPFIHAAGLVANPAGAPFSEGRFQMAIFATAGITPIGYAAFAFALGVTIGLLVRRTVPAMAITLAIFAAVWIAMPLAIRPHLMTPDRVTTPLDASVIQGWGINQPGSDLQVTVGSPPNLAGAWIYSTQVINAAGSANLGQAPQACRGNFNPRSCGNAIRQLPLRQVTVYQPASRFWDFQGIETGIFAVLALLLAGSCFWLVRRRLS